MSPSKDSGSKRMSDGGSQGQENFPSSSEENIFYRTSDQETEKTGRWSQKVRRTLNANVYAPLAVAWSDLRTRVGGMIILLFVFTGTVGVAVLDQPTAMEGPIFLSPFQSIEHPLGTDNLGRDMLKLLVAATPAMFKMVISGALLSVAIGTVVGTVAGYRGGYIDSVLMTIADVILTIPALVLVIVLASIYPPENPYLVGLLLGIDNWPGLSRTIRSQVLSIREESFTESSRIMGLSQWHIFRKDIISNLMPYISVNFATSARSVIFESVALYFLGILPFTTENWGVIMNSAYEGSGYITDIGKIHYLIEPMLAIIFFSLGFLLFAQGLDSVFNVRLQAKHEREDSEENESKF